MPNGGPDNCGTCGFNRRNRGIWRNPEVDEQQMPFCEIRGVTVLWDLFTYCQNWHTRTSEPIGPIYASGLYDAGYRRIPWHGSVEPEQVGRGVCSECGEPFAERHRRCCHGKRAAPLLQQPALSPMVEAPAPARRRADE